MDEWQKKEVGEVAAFFDVDVNKGLSSSDVIKRINKFGIFSDYTLNPSVESLLNIKVRRDAQIKKISIKNIVPGDVIILEEGVRVPAILRLFQVKALRINQTSITGEPLAAEKNTFATDSSDKIMQKCLAFKGTFVTSGSGMGIVCETPAKVKKRKKEKFLSLISSRNLKKYGIIVQNTQVPKRLKNLDLVLVDISMVEQNILELISKVQMAKNLKCIFIVKSEVAARLKKDLKDPIIYEGKDINKHFSKQILNLIHDAQFITDINSTGLIKLFRILNSHGINYLYACEGYRNPDVLRAACTSLLIGDYGRDDSIWLADLIAPKSTPLIIDSILHNKL